MLKKHKRIMPIILIILAFLFLISMSSVSAANHAVLGTDTSTDIENYINSDIDPESVVEFADGTYNLTDITISKPGSTITFKGTGTQYGAKIVPSSGANTLFNIQGTKVNIINLDISGFNTAINSDYGYLNISDNKISTIDGAIIISGNGDLEGISIENNIIDSDVDSTNYGAISISAPVNSIVSVSLVGNEITANTGSDSIGVLIEAIDCFTDLTFIDNIITGELNGVYIDADYSEDTSITFINNEITGIISGVLMFLSYSINSTILFDNNTIVGGDVGVGLVAYGSDGLDVTFVDNRISGDYGVGIDASLSNNTNILFDNNTIEGITAGVDLYTNLGDNTEITFTENEIKGDNGVQVDASFSNNTNILFDNNTIEGINAGVLLDTFADNNTEITFTDNTITGDYGIQVDASFSDNTNILFDNNTIEGINAGVLLDTSTGNNTEITFTDNTITGDYGVQVDASYSDNTNILFDNNTIEGLTVGILLDTSTGNNTEITFTDNTITGDNGVQVAASYSDNTNINFINNDILNSAGPGSGVLLDAANINNTSILFDNNNIQGFYDGVNLITDYSDNINVEFTNNNIIGINAGVVLRESGSDNANIVFNGNNIEGGNIAMGIISSADLNGLSLLNNTFTGVNYGLYFYVTSASLSNILIKGNTIIADDYAIFFDDTGSSFVNVTVNYNRILGTVGLDYSSVSNDDGSNFDYNWWGQNDISNKIIGFDTDNHYILNITNTTSLNNAKTGDILNFALLVLNTTLTNDGVENLPYFEINGTFNGVAYNTSTDDLFMYQLTIPTSGLQTIDAELDDEYVELQFNTLKANINSTIIAPKEVDLGKPTTIRGVLKNEDGNILANVQLTVTIDGVAYIVTTNSAGEWNLSYTPKKLGNIQIVVKFAENASYFAFTNSTTFKTITGTILSVSAPTINQGKKTNIKVTLTDLSGNVLKDKKISLTINGKRYTATTNNKRIVIFNIAGLKGGKHNFSVKFAGDDLYKSSLAPKIQNVKVKVDLAINSVKKLKSANKKVSKYKVTIVNKGSLKSKAITLSLFHIRKGIKIKTKNIKIKAIKAGQKISVIISYYPDKAYHRHCKAYFTIDPKNKNKEIILANNKKSVKH